MKPFVTTLLLALLLGLGATLSAQTTLDDQAFVNGQITGPGVYLVESGKVYFFDGFLDISWDVTIEGPDVDWIRNAESPPVLVNIPDAAGAAQVFINIYAGGSLTLKNLIMSGLASNDAVCGDMIISWDDGGDAFTSDNVAFVDYRNRAFFNRGNDIDISMTNCFFINAQDLGYSPWGGDPIRIQGKPAYVLLENNTVVNHSRIQGNGGPGRVIFHQLHNTFLNGAKMSLEIRAFESITANNLFYNYDFLGSKSTSIIYERYMLTWNYFSDYSHKLDSVATYFGQNAFFKQDEIYNWFATQGGDSINDVYLTDGKLWEFADTDSFVTLDGGDFKIGTNYIEIDPVFATNPDNLTPQVQFLDEFWYPDNRGPDWPDWRVQSPVTYTAEQVPVLNWPPAFDLAYSNAYLQTAATDGLPVGDLNWFPAQKATYETNRDSYIAALQDSILNAKAIYDGEGQTPLITPVTSIEDGQDDLLTPNRFSLNANYPNPFNPGTTLKFSLAKTGNISFKIYDITGQLVITIFDEDQHVAGPHSVYVDMANFSSGIYFAVLNNGSQKLTRKMMLIK